MAGGGLDNKQAFSLQDSYPDPTSGPLVGGLSVGGGVGSNQEMPGVAMRGTAVATASAAMAGNVGTAAHSSAQQGVVASTGEEQWTKYWDKANQRHYWHDGKESVSRDGVACSRSRW